MTERRNPHLADETLNEFLDQALGPAARAAAAEHLATCAACSARLEALSAVFSSLAELPPAPLGRDLRPALWRPCARRDRRNCGQSPIPGNPRFK
jgi:anti-sigma factor RsiW